MQALHRTADESVIITTPDGYRIKISVTSFYQNGVLLSVDAHPEVTVVREEMECKQPCIIRKILDKRQAFPAVNK